MAADRTGAEHVNPEEEDHPNVPEADHSEAEEDLLHTVQADRGQGGGHKVPAEERREVHEVREILLAEDRAVRPAGDHDGCSSMAEGALGRCVLPGVPARSGDGGEAGGYPELSRGADPGVHHSTVLAGDGRAVPRKERGSGRGRGGRRSLLDEKAGDPGMGRKVPTEEVLLVPDQRRGLDDILRGERWGGEVLGGPVPAAAPGPDPVGDFPH